MLSDAMVHVTCDTCKYDQEYTLTALARNGWDERDLERELIRDGWKIDGDSHYCADCCEDKEA